MGGRESVLKDTKVVVVGGGYGGAQAVSLLRGKCQLTVIDAREYYHYCIGGPRATVEPGFEKKILISYAEAWPGIYQQGKVVGVNPKEKVVLLESGEAIPYDIVIIATGCRGPFPSKIKLDVKTQPEAEELFQAKQKQVQSAGRITVIGGGAVGVEMAAEIATEYPQKEVTVVSSSDKIITGPFKKGFRDGVTKQLKNLGVHLVLGERVSNLMDLPTDGSSSCTVKTDGGLEIETDLVIIATGLQVNTEAYEAHFSDAMDESNCLKVNQFLQVDGYTDVFAVGDCNNADQVKMAFKAELQMKVIANNMQALLTGGTMSPYKEKNLIMLTLGRYGGMTQYGSFVAGSLVTRMKARDVFVGRTRKLFLDRG
ncbi:ferroptosis suppressor protein 1-like isoform X2 [Apostichopus japonicus]|uniref:ferroptosis suppressor protein 1-like isoform X2 n=1 Tax=Stichopus japonicus TaxID=307972 RepID=UPI003AB5ACC6